LDISTRPPQLGAEVALRRQGHHGDL